jgi:hypothetical protein
MSILMMKSKVAAAGIAAAVAAAPAVALASQPGHAPARGAASTVNWQIPLKGGPAYRTANGSGQYQSQPGQRDLQVEVQRIRSLAGKTVVFSAAGRTLGSAKVSALGQADISRNTEVGQKVPSINRGSRVTVRTTGGKLIVSGRF